MQRQQEIAIYATARTPNCWLCKASLSGPTVFFLCKIKIFFPNLFLYKIYIHWSNQDKSPDRKGSTATESDYLWNGGSCSSLWRSPHTELPCLTNTAPWLPLAKSVCMKQHSTLGDEKDNRKRKTLMALQMAVAVKDKWKHNKHQISFWRCKKSCVVMELLYIYLYYILVSAPCFIYLPSWWHRGLLVFLYE